MGKKARQRRNTAFEEKSRMFRGTFSAAAAGFGFFLPENGEEKECFVPPVGVGPALDGDTVEAQVFYPDRNGRIFGHLSKGPVAYIKAVLERGRKTIAARLDSRHSAQPMDRHLPDTIAVNSVPRGTKTGEWVQLRLLPGGSKHTEKLRGAVEERLGMAGTVEGDLNAVMAEFKLEPPYTAEQEKAASAVKKAEIEREDMTDLAAITIDPSDACDFDDALTIAVTGKNEVTLGVHIADVAAWIRQGTKFDKEAAKRGFSSYLPGRFLPMLPKSLTQKISLQQGEVSSAHSVFFTIRRNDGKILSVRRAHTQIKVVHRLTYDEVQNFLSDPENCPAGWSKTFKDELTLLATTARRLRAKRLKQEEFLMIDTVDTRALCNEETGEVTAIDKRTQTEADQLVEECMLAANSAVANELIERQVAGLYRVHPWPTPEKIEEFSLFVKNSFKLKTGDIISSRAACQKFLASVPDDHRKSVILSAFLRALPRASYAEDPSIHFGLGKTRYSHFTSPIRRYTDLLIHQQLWNLDTKKNLESKKFMGEQAVRCTHLEEANDNAFFAANDRMKLHYLMQHHALEDGTLYEGVITKVTAGGLLCDVQELGLYGFVPSTFLRGGEYRRSRNRHSAKFQGSHTEYNAGDFVYLVLDSLDMVRGSAIFRISI